MVLKATLKSNFYNPALSYWEPLIEAWPFSITMGPSDVEPHAKNVLLVSSESELDVLIVHHSLERLLQMLKKLGATDPKKSKISRKLSSPYRFTNLIEYNIVVEDVANSDRSIIVETGATQDFSFLDWKQSRNKAIKSNHLVNIQVKGFKMIENISLDRDGVIKLQLEASEEGKDSVVHNARTIFLQSFLEHGIRCLFFRESLMLINQTSFTLLLTVEAAETGKTFSIEPEKHFSLAPHWMNSTFQVVPDDGDHEASQYFELCDGMKLDGVVLLAPALKSGKPPVNIIISCCQPSLESTCNMCFVAPICLENLLPATCQLRFKQGPVQVLHSISENQSVSIFDVDPSKSYSVAISIPELGVFSTNECPVDANSKEPQVLSMQNEQGLELKIQMTRVPCGSSTKLSFSAFYLLVNQTSMTIQVLSHTHSKNKKTDQIFTVPPSEDGKPFVMFSQPNPKNVKNRVLIRVADSAWSHALSFETVGAETEINSKSILTSKWYNISGYVGLGQGKVCAYSNLCLDFLVVC